MWRAIAGRAGRQGGQVLPFRRAVRVALPIAAVLVVGIFVGRMTMVDSQRSTVNGAVTLSAAKGSELGLSCDSSAASRPQSDIAVVDR
jgi:hypothetical protein